MISKIVSSVTAMDVEIQVAVQFIVSFLSGKLSEEDTEKYSNCLLKLLIEKFEGHWYPDKPAKGSAYRCISVENQIDNVLLKAAQETSIEPDMLSSLLPKKLDLWIDPAEVSYRIGERFCSCEGKGNAKNLNMRLVVCFQFSICGSFLIS